MRHNAIKTFDGKTAATIDQLSAVSLTRPAGDANLHLQVQYSLAGDFSDAVEAILTSVEADRGKVRFFDGEASAAFPADGLSDDYAGQRVVVDLSAVPLQVWLRYRWYAASGEPSGAWRGLYHPSSGGVEEVVSAVQANGALVVSLTGTIAGRWSIDAGATWHESGTALTLAPGSFTVTYQPVAGYVTPAPAAATIVAGQVTTIAGDYVAEVVDPYADWGYLQVTLTGADAGRWTIDSGDTWHESGVKLYVPAGPYGVQFEPVNGYATPIEQIVTVSADQETRVTGVYVVVQPDSSSLQVEITGTDAGRWSIDDGVTWHGSGDVVATTADGEYIVTFLPVDGYTTPSPMFVVTWAGRINEIRGRYVEPVDPSDYGMIWETTARPSKHTIYVSTSGAGRRDGSSWEDAAAGLESALILATDGDVLFLQEGTYNHSLINKAVTIYGGFPIGGGGVWASRDGFAHPTIIVKDIQGKLTANDVSFDGVFFQDFKLAFDIPKNITKAIQGTVKNCVFANFGVDDSYNPWYDLNVAIIDGEATNSLFVDCGFTLAEREGYGRVISFLTGFAANCTFMNCSVDDVMITGDATNCTFTNCSSGDNLVAGGATNCAFTFCYSHETMITGGATNCTFTDSWSPNNIVEDGATNCTFTNCIVGSVSLIVYGDATNCTFTNCSSNDNLVAGGAMTNCTLVRCVAERLQVEWPVEHPVTNCVIFDCDINTISFGGGTNNAASAYIDASTLELGTDNTLALFTSLGTVTTKGWSSALNNTPLADYGEFRPQTGSVLIGAGVAVAGITTDITGATRSDPPTIGAYEGVND